jgi:hypothetical protein
MNGERNGSHAKALEKICNNSKKILGINPREILVISKEQRLYYRGSLLTEVDIVFELKKGRIILVEYKSDIELALIKKGREQLYKAITFYEDSLNKETRGILVIGERVFQEGDKGYFRKGYSNGNIQKSSCSKPFYLNGRRNRK